MTSVLILRGAAIAAAVTLSVVDCAIAAALHGAIPRDVPVDRLVANLEKYIAEHPEDPDGYYRLGRVHTMALETKMGFVLAYDVREGEPERPAEGSWAHRRWGEKQHPPLTEEQLKAHLEAAVRNLNKAIEMRPTAARFRLTLACALEAGEPLQEKIDVWVLGPPREPPSLDSPSFYADLFRAAGRGAKKALKDLLAQIDGTAEHYAASRDFIMDLAYTAREMEEYRDVVKALRAADWHEQIATQYFTAMCAALPEDSRATEKAIWGGMEVWASYEAGKSFLRVVRERGRRPADKIRVRVAEAAIKGFDSLPAPRAITPVIFSVKEGVSLGDLVDADARCSFDLDGSGVGRQWSWVTPESGILVWDPENTGRITSGRQLFGSITWWLFFENGYQALDTLDDNRDGEIAGDELKGLAVWFDRNRNGASDSGEVVPIMQLGVAAISVRATGTTDGCPSNRTGLRMSDGRELPTYDWIATRR